MEDEIIFVIREKAFERLLAKAEDLKAENEILRQENALLSALIAYMGNTINQLKGGSRHGPENHRGS